MYEKMLHKKSLKISSSRDFQGLKTKQGRTMPSLEMDQSYLSLFLFMTIRTSAFATFVIRHFFLTPFLDGTHDIS